MYHAYTYQEGVQRVDTTSTLIDSLTVNYKYYTYNLNSINTPEKKARQGASIDRKKRLSRRISVIRDSTTTKQGAIFLVSEFQGADDFSDRQVTLIVDIDDIRIGIISRICYDVKKI